MLTGESERTPKPRVVRLGGREIVTEGLQLSFWADISHRCMTASWPAFIAGAALVFVAFNSVFAMLYWIGDDPISNVPHRAYIDYLYFSIETLSTAGYGDMHPQTHGDIRFGQRYADVLDTTEDGRIRIDYGRFHDTLES